MRYISDRIAVIHKGDIVELADAEELVTHAIRGIDLDVYHGEVLAIVGESGP